MFPAKDVGQAVERSLTVILFRKICMPEKSYQNRDVLDKLGIRPGHALTLVNTVQYIEAELFQRVVERTGCLPATSDEALDLVLVGVDRASDAVEVLRQWRSRLVAGASIWLLTAKRGQPGYIDQRELIAAGQQAELVDNKICSLSSTVSAMRFVIRRKSASVV